MAVVTLVLMVVALTACGTVDRDALLTREEAISLALKAENLTEDAVYDLDAELDREFGYAVWEVDFDTREYEYSYNINAETGEILRADRDRD